MKMALGKRGAHNIGRFALSMVPWALGIGLAVWIGDWLWIHEIRQSIQLEKRDTRKMEKPE